MYLSAHRGNAPFDSNIDGMVFGAAVEEVKKCVDYAKAALA
jgi:hypothetical protein